MSRLSVEHPHPFASHSPVPSVLWKLQNILLVSLLLVYLSVWLDRGEQLTTRDDNGIPLHDMVGGKGLLWPK